MKLVVAKDYYQVAFE